MLSTLFFQLRKIPDEFTLDILPGHTIGEVDHLFARVDEVKAQEFKVKYRGKQDGSGPTTASVTDAAAASKRKPKGKTATAATPAANGSTPSAV